MDPKAKAKEIYLFYSEVDNTKESAKFCVDAIIAAVERFCYSNTMFRNFDTGQIATSDEVDPVKYWNDVDEELSKI